MLEIFHFPVHIFTLNQENTVRKKKRAAGMRRHVAESLRAMAGKGWD